MALQAEFDRLTQERDFHDARKQEATRRINEVLAEGRILATTLQTVLNNVSAREAKSSWPSEPSGE